MLAAAAARVALALQRAPRARTAQTLSLPWLAPATARAGAARGGPASAGARVEAGGEASAQADGGGGGGGEEAQGAVWHVVTADGCCKGNPGPAAQGAVLYDPRGWARCVRHSFSPGTHTNNESEYLAVDAALSLAEEELLGAAEGDGGNGGGGPGDGVRLLVVGDSQVILRQLDGRYKIRGAELNALRARVRTREARFGDVRYAHVRREWNARADRASNAALDEFSGSGEAMRRDTRVDTEFEMRDRSLRLELPDDMEQENPAAAEAIAALRVAYAEAEGAEEVAERRCERQRERTARPVRHAHCGAHPSPRVWLAPPPPTPVPLPAANARVRSNARWRTDPMACSLSPVRPAGRGSDDGAVAAAAAAVEQIAKELVDIEKKVATVRRKLMGA